MADTATKDPITESTETKSTEVGVDDLMEKIKAAVKEAVGGGESIEGLKEDGDTGGETLDAKLRKAVAEIMAKRQACKESGEEYDDSALEAELLAALLGISGTEDLTKSAPAPAQTKEAPKVEAPVQRKYSNFFMINHNGGETVKEAKKIPADVQLARAVKCFDVWQNGRKDPEEAARLALKKYGDENMAKEFKALNATTPSAGGYLIPEIYMQEIIELLYPNTVIFSLGARKVPMSNGNLNIPKMTSGARATWGGEQRKIAKTQPKFGNIRLSAKRLEAIVPQTRELLMSTDYSADAIFAQDLTRRMQLGLDYGALYGEGGEFQPLGLVNTAGILVIDAATVTNTNLVTTGGAITADFPVFVRSSVLAKNVDDRAMGWTFNSMMEGFLMNLKTTTGAYIYRDEMNGGKLLGFPYKVSNQIGTVANKTEIIFGNWADLLVGEQLGLETYTAFEGSWVDENGIQRNAFEENLVATRALMYVDIAARHAESFAHIKNCAIA